MSSSRQLVNTLAVQSLVLVFTRWEAIQEYLGQINNIYLINSTSQWVRLWRFLFSGQHLFSENGCKCVLTIYIKTSDDLYYILVLSYTCPEGCT